VTSFNPLTVYIYDEPYARFSAENYNADNVNNLYSHLTNNSIAKYSKNFDNSEIEGNMWDIQTFQGYIDVINKLNQGNLWTFFVRKNKKTVLGLCHFKFAKLQKQDRK
jgi:hypothetical protein